MERWQIIMNKESKKLTWAVGLVAGLGVLSIAYAALSSTLNIKGEGASVNVGYVHFQNSSAAHGIGSTNDEYISNEKETQSGGIFDGRKDANKPGLILSTGFSEGLTKSLAEPGEKFELIKTKKTDDTVQITGAKLNDYGSFIVYKLDIKNDSANGMKLKTRPDVTISKSEGDADVSNIDAVLYTKCEDANFVSPCSVPLEVYSGSGSESADAPNYLTAGGTTTWYLRVGFKNYNDTSNNISGSSKFTFSVSPNWEADIENG